MYSSEKIAGLLQKKGVVPIRCDMTSKSARTRALTRLLNAYGAYSIPFMVIHPRGDEWNKPYRFRDVVTISEVAEVLERLPDGLRIVE